MVHVIHAGPRNELTNRRAADVRGIAEPGDELGNIDPDGQRRRAQLRSERLGRAFIDVEIEGAKGRPWSKVPLAEGWEDRVPLHQLFPLLVHACLFGGGYGARAGEAARSLL